MTRPLALTVLALAAAGLTGCSEFSEQTTALQYTPAEGTQLNLRNGVGVRNALLLSEAQGDPANLLATLVNHSSEDMVVSFSGEGISGSIPIQSGRTVMVGPEGDTQLEVAATPARPGELVTVEVSAGSASGELKVPVLDGTLPEFQTLVPTVSGSPTASPTATPSAGATPTTEATASPPTGGEATQAPTPSGSVSVTVTP